MAYRLFLIWSGFATAKGFDWVSGVPGVWMPEVPFAIFATLAVAAAVVAKKQGQFT